VFFTIYGEKRELLQNTQKIALLFSASIDYQIVVTRSDDVYAIAPDIYSAGYIYEIMHADYYFAVEIRTQDNEGNWSGWRVFADGAYIGKAFQMRFKIVFAEAGAYVLIVERFSYSIDVPDRVETIYNTFVSKDDGLVWVFDPPFNAQPSVVGSIIDVDADDRKKRLYIADDADNDSEMISK
jgi:hypothetical protein